MSKKDVMVGVAMGFDFVFMLAGFSFVLLPVIVSGVFYSMIGFRRTLMISAIECSMIETELIPYLVEFFGPYAIIGYVSGIVGGAIGLTLMAGFTYLVIKTFFKRILYRIECVGR